MPTDSPACLIDAISDPRRSDRLLEVKHFAPWVTCSSWLGLTVMMSVTFVLMFEVCNCRADSLATVHRQDVLWRDVGLEQMGRT